MALGRKLNSQYRIVLRSRWIGCDWISPGYAGLWIPQMDLAVIARRGQQVALRAKGNAPDPSPMASHRLTHWLQLARCEPRPGFDQTVQCLG
jgi:hypothetical protein